jgi:hypothetical protein
VKKTGLLFILFACIFCTNITAQTDTSHLRVSLLTCAPGDELYSTFGHTALRLVDSSKQTDIIYNYGTFDFDDPDFYVKFTRGKLNYFLSVESLPQFMYEYQMEKRAVIEQELNIPASAKTAIADALTENLAGANRYYKYDFLYNNCTSRIRDIIQKYAGLSVPSPLVPQKTTFRNMLHEYLDKGGKPWSKLGIDLLLASPIDKKVTITQSMFLPDYLMKGIDSAAPGKDGSFIKSRTVINAGSPSAPGSNYWPLFILSGVCIVIAFVSLLKNKTAQTLTKVFDVLLFLKTGLIGCLLLFMWFGTDHKSCAVNYNLLWALPTHLIAAFTVWKRPKGLSQYFTASSVLYCLLLITWLWLPQQLNPAFIPVVLLLLFRSVQLRKVYP